MLNLDPHVELPARSSVERALVLLHRRLGASKVLSAAEACENYARDEPDGRGRTPDAVVSGSCAEDITSALAVASETGVPLTPRAGATGRVGGAVPVAGGIVLSVQGMDQVRGIDVREGTAVVEPGVVLADFHHAVESEGWFYPPDPNSLAGCTLGGNVATNAGGPRAFKYGVTRNYVLGLDAMLIGG